ncbi:hypothetical protein RRG08_066990 [Elysia crispata]|uniref:TOG domain-containing protein n=1 Tax=Elysia crispata TaxID=231223 RepID=A0AAE0Z9P0_9GAST|nr:hypothetical protein RRG08_066990 [Elysia crispata]
MSKASAGGSGAVDEELFIKSFEDVPPVKIFSSRDVQEHMQKAKDVLSDSSCMWEKRIDNCKVLRALLISGAADYDDFFQSLRTLESAFIMVVKDLRSQVVREGCITIAYLSQQLGSKFDHFAEAVLPSLLNLIPNSAKVMSTSGMVCIRFIMQFVHTNRLIPIICGSTTSKSNIIRRACLEFVNQLLHSWPTHCLEKHIALLQESIKRGISDADSEARVHSRKAFWGFADHFKSQADALLNSLDASKQKLLQGEVSNSSSSSSLNNGDHHQARPRARSRAASEERSGAGGGGSSGYGYSHGSSTLRKASQRISSSKSDAGDVRIITPRARAVASNGVSSSGYGQNHHHQGYTSHNQHYNTIGHSRSRTAGSSARSVGGGGTSTLGRGGASSNFLEVPAPLARSSSAADVSSTSSSMPAGEVRRCTTPKPRATILSAARMAKGSASSLQLMSWKVLLARNRACNDVQRMKELSNLRPPPLLGINWRHGMKDRSYTSFIPRCCSVTFTGPVEVS